MKKSHLTLLLIIVFFSTFCISLFAGHTDLTSNLSELLHFDNYEAVIFWQLRVPRTLTALTCGGLLALAGVMMQLLLQNPLADPYVLGVSGGAACLTLLLSALGLGELAYQTGAWLGSLLTIVLILFFSRQHPWQAQRLLLIGIALASGFSTVISFILLLSNTNTLHSLLFWLSGDLNNAHYPWFGLALLIIGTCCLLSCAKGLDLYMRGEQEAKMLGLAVNRYQWLLLLMSTLFTACAVTLAGCLGFIGLIIPHLTRSLLGFQHTRLIPAVILLGASLLMAADTIARTLLAPQQLPVGLLMTAIGVPVFIWLLKAC